MKILENIRVLDLTRMVAGPVATQNLADMGATVYKIERPQVGDDTRKIGPFLKDKDGKETNSSAFFLAANRGKQSITVDITTPEGAKIIRELVKNCDVFVENYKAGNLKKYGLDYDSIKQICPEIIYCSITGFGQDGPYAPRPAYDFILQGMVGLMSTTGHPAEHVGAEPMRTGIPMTDVLTGQNAAIAIMGALYHRLHTGKGQWIDVAMIDSAVHANGHLALGYLMTGDVPQAAGNANPVASPSDVFPCKDGYLIIAAGNDSQFASLCRLFHLEHLIDDPEYRSNSVRVKNRHQLRQMICDAICLWSKGDLVKALEIAGVPCGPINRMDQVFADPQVKHRHLEKHLPHSSGVDAPSLRSPLTFSLTPVEHIAPPVLGEHTQTILKEVLGLSNEQIKSLQDQKVIS